ncbi:MAG: molybdopterin oxidoreductase family protein [Burkholderiales bacterium]|nr:molybdopterin oxidoreductase family protein [Burkholderiales bacterium]MCA3154936.1 molybdopterin oxidoreductase family protein [Burkholderiales bacterium]MCA3156820.1 molybdopterin oxidoreductase family protein [Burkholderiales bacterium]MCA3167290.1 molybdopterin oxidoreductase family protein [Burkholderiales bacterium]
MPVKIVKAACPHDCPDTCAMQVQVEDGRAIKVMGDPLHPTTRGTLCTKVARYTERTYHAERLLTPLRRTGRKGEGKFKPISWSEALDEISQRLKRIASVDPQRIVPYSYAGTMGLVQGEAMAARFFHRLGASLLDRTICASAGTVGLSYTIGTPRLAPDMENVVDAQLIVIWGGNPVASNLHFWTFAQEAKRRGAKLIAIDPYRSLTAEKCHEHLAVLPGSDSALALGVMHILIRQGWIDQDYIERYTLGFEALKQRVAEFDPERVAGLCGLTIQQVESLAHDIGTIKPCFIRMNYGLQRVRGGGMAVRNIACLPALTGDWRSPAGGVLLSASGMHNVDNAALQRPDLLAGKTPRTINMSTIGDDLLQADPPIEALIVYNSNPVAVAPQAGKVAQGFAREDLFTVVLEHFQTDTADYADIVLPATTQLEHFDIHKSYGHLYALINHPAIEPLGQAKPNSEIFRLLADAVGFEDPCFRESDEQIAQQAYPDLDWRVLNEQGWQRLPLPESWAPFAAGGFKTPSGKCEFYSESMAQAGLDPLPAYVPTYEVHDAGLQQRYPLALISPPARHFLNSTFVNVKSLRDVEGEPHLDLHPCDAEVRDIESGQRVRVFNDRGSVLLTARVTDKAKPGVPVALSIWWKKLSGDGKNINELTSQSLTDMGQAPTFYDCRVQVERVD